MDMTSVVRAYWHFPIGTTVTLLKGLHNYLYKYTIQGRPTSRYKFYTFKCDLAMLFISNCLSI